MSQPDPLDLIRRQIVDLQERTTALEKTPPSQRPDGALEGLVAAALKAITSTVRTAAEAKAARPEAADTPVPEPTRPAVRDAVQRAADSVARAKAAAAPLFPIAEPEPAAPFAGRTGPRRTLPPEAPVRLWNREHTDHLDVIGRAVPGDGTGPGVSLRVRDKDSAAALGWLAATYQHGGAFVAWMEREWTLADWFHRSGAEVTLDLLPLPKPPRVDEVLGRAPYAGPFPHLAKGDRIGVEHADGTITTHEFSGDHEHPVADEPDRAGRWRAVETMGRQFAERFYREPEPAPEAYTMPDGVGLGTVPEYGKPVGTAHANIINTAPVDLDDPRVRAQWEGIHTEPFHPDGDRAARGDGWPTPTEFADKYFRRTPVLPDDGSIPNPLPPSPEMELTNDYPEPDVDEVLPMPGGPNDKLAQGLARNPRFARMSAAEAVAYRTERTAAGGPSISFHYPDGARASADTTSTELDSPGAHVQIADPYVKAWLRAHIDHGDLRADWNGTTWTVTGMAWPFDDVTAVALMPLDEPARPTIPRHPAQAAPDALTGGYASLYARLPYLHDAVAEEDQ